MKLRYLGVVGLLLMGSLVAGDLPMLQEKPWLGVFVGYEGRGFDFALGSDGESQIHFKKGRTRISGFNSFKVHYVLEEFVGKRWVRRQMSQEGFETTQEASEDVEEVTFVATYTGDTKVQIVHRFDKGLIEIESKVLAKTTENEIRIGVEVAVSDLYRSVKEKGLSKRELRDKIKDAQVRGVTMKGKRLKVDLDENPELDGEEFFADGAKEISIESDKIAGREVLLRTKNEDAGRIEVEQSREAFHGFRMIWWPDPAKIGTEGCVLELQVK